MSTAKPGGGSKQQKRRLVQETAAELRDLILSKPPETQIGSLNEVAQMLRVGIVTVQQAARILEHEGLLAVRRGPGGGYYGTRPDESALERLLAAYVRAHGFGYREALETMALLDCQIVPAAARCTEIDLRERLRGLFERIDTCDTPEARIVLEDELRNVLFKMVSQPFIEFLSRVTGRQFQLQPHNAIFAGDEGVAAWKIGRKRMLEAVLRQDEELARFEAERFRQEVFVRLRTGSADINQ